MFQAVSIPYRQYQYFACLSNYYIPLCVSIPYRQYQYALVLPRLPCVYCVSIPYRQYQYGLPRKRNHRKTMFQFLIGSISTAGRAMSAKEMNKFQFLIGSISTVLLRPPQRLYRSFNSLQVVSVLCGLGTVTGLLGAFQFLIGSISTILLWVIGKFLIEFQFLIGSISTFMQLSQTRSHPCFNSLQVVSVRILDYLLAWLFLCFNSLQVVSVRGTYVPLSDGEHSFNSLQVVSVLVGNTYVSLFFRVSIPYRQYQYESLFMFQHSLQKCFNSLQVVSVPGCQWKEV